MTKFEDVKHETTEEYFRNNQFSIDAFNKKYTDTSETYVLALKRVCDAVASVEETPALQKYWSERWFDEIYNDWWHPAGSIMQGAGSGRKVSLVNCFRRNTEFITKAGIKSFEDFVDGDDVEVLVNIGTFAPAKVKNFGKDKLSKITLAKNGVENIIYATANHRWRIADNNESINIKTTADLNAGDLIPNIKRKTMKPYLCPLGFIHGLVFGDGHYCKSSDTCTLDLCGDSRQFEKFFTAFNWKINKYEDRTRISYLPNYMKLLPNFEQCNKEYILGFLAGWFAADGSIDKDGRAFLYHNDKDVLEKIAKILCLVGMQSSSIIVKRETNSIVIQNKLYANRQYNLYALYFDKATLFEEFFVKDNHKNNYQSWTNNRLVVKRNFWKVVSVEETDIIEDVWCVQVPGYENFVLAGGQSTCNCTTVNGGTLSTDEEWDNLESIVKGMAYDVAKYAAYRQGLGLDFSRLRPKDMGILNSSKVSSGVVHWMRYIDQIGYFVGQNGRIPAMLFSLNVSHPDIEEFITVKSDYTKIQNANISVQATSAFYLAAEQDKEWECRFEIPEIIAGQEVYVNRSVVDDSGKFKQNEYGWYYIATHDKPKEVMVKKVPARKLLRLIAENMWKNAEPGAQNIDIARYWSNSDYVYDPCAVYDTRIVSTNACCVDGQTEILTSTGFHPIVSLENEFVSVWNGQEFSKVQILETNQNQEMLEISFSNGEKLKCTKYHKFPIIKNDFNGHVMVEAKDLQIGDKLIKCQFPSISSGTHYNNMYSSGFYAADGQKNTKLIWLYGNKIKCADRLEGKFHGQEYTIKSGVKRRPFFLSFEPYGKTFVPLDGTEYSKLEWFAGLIDGDGSVTKDGSIQIASINKAFLIKVKRMLNTCGVDCKVLPLNDAGYRLLPSHDGNDGRRKYYCQATYRLCLSSKYVAQLVEKGLKCSRVSLDKAIESPKRENNKYVKVVGIKEAGIAEKVYCFDEPKRHMGIFNGVITGQSEQYLSPDSCCVLGSVNCGRFSIITTELQKELEIIGESVCRFLDNVNTLELQAGTYATEKQALAIRSLRRVGAGVTNICAWLLKQNLEYGSDEGNDAITNFMKWYNYNLYKTSISLGQEKGSFEAFNREKFETSPFVQNMMDQGLIFKAMRNVTCSSIAPTGTLSLMFRDTVLSYGGEPGFGLYYWKRTRISGKYEYYFIVPSVVKECFADAGFTIPIESETIKDDWEGNRGKPIAKFIDKHKDEVGLKFRPATEVHYLDKLNLMSKVMEHVDSSISITYMLPEESSIEEVENLILEANRKGVKSIAAFPDKKMYGIVSSIPFYTLAADLISSGTQIHNQNFTSTELERLERVAIKEGKCIAHSDIDFNEREAPERPKMLPCDVHVTQLQGKDFFVLVGLYNNRPYEIFAGENKHLQRYHHSGVITKKTRGKYEFSMEGKVIMPCIQDDLTEDQETITRLVSIGLRHSIQLEPLVRQLEKVQGNLYSFAKILSRILKKYIQDGTKVTGAVCTKCQSTNLERQEGCITCIDCGNSRCG